MQVILLIGEFGVAVWSTRLCPQPILSSLCVQRIEGNRCCVVSSHLKPHSPKCLLGTGLQTQPVLCFSSTGATAKSLFGATFYRAKGRDSPPSRRRWTARRRWGKRRASTRPVQVNLCGRVLFSTHLLYTPRSSRRSSGSLFRPDTHRHRCPQSPASTWSCLKRWRCVGASHPGQNSSKKKRQSQGW